MTIDATARARFLTVRRPSGGVRRWRSQLRSAVVLLVTGLFLLPILLMLRMSLAGPGDSAFGSGAPRWGNYRDAFAAMKYLPAVLHTAGLTVTSAVATIFAGSLAAYPLARLTRAWAKPVYLVFVAGLTVPFFVLLTPLYLLMRDLGLLGTWGGVVLIYTAFNLPLAVFFYTSFLRSVPAELEEAAVVDGAGPWRVFWSIVFPLLRPATATLAIFVSLSVWNDLVVPLVFLADPDKSTVMLSAYNFVGSYGFKPNELFPAVVLATAPLLLFFFVLQRHIVAGIASGAVKS